LAESSDATRGDSLLACALAPSGACSGIACVGIDVDDAGDFKIGVGAATGTGVVGIDELYALLLLLMGEELPISLKLLELNRMDALMCAVSSLGWFRRSKVNTTSPFSGTRVAFNRALTREKNQ